MLAKLTERQVDDDVIPLLEVVTNIAGCIRKVCLWRAPVVRVDGARAALHIARDVGCRAGPEP